MDDSCVFCAIVAGHGEASIVATTERAVAFMDTLPVGAGHTLVVPRAHAVGLGDLDPDDGAEMFRLAQRIAAAQLELGMAAGVNLFLADGVAAGQEVFHAHLHVLPRWQDDAMTLHVDYEQPPPRPELDAVAERLSAAIR